MNTILFSSAGRRTELLNCFREDAAALQMPLRVLAVDLQPELSAACHSADARFAVPRCTHPNFVPAMLEICEREKVKLLVPTIDTELETFAAAQDQFLAIGTRVHISDLVVVKMARNKKATAEFLSRHGIPNPKTGATDDVLSHPNAWRWPLILKPIGGSSSVGIQVARDLDQFKFLSTQRDDYLAQELWQGREYTINIFFDQSGKLRCAIPHLRKETRTGEVIKGLTERHPLLMQFAEQLAEAFSRFGVLASASEALPSPAPSNPSKAQNVAPPALPLSPRERAGVRAPARGALCFQAIINDAGEGVVFEINARFGGGYPLAHRAGGTFSKWLLEEIDGRESSAHNNWQSGLMMLRYDAAIFAETPKV